MKKRQILLRLFAFVVLMLAAHGVALATDGPQVATVNAGLGTCSADFTVKNASGKPLYGAKITASIKYGFLNKREVDLDNATNSNGEALFTGLPNFPKKPIDFLVASGTASKTISDDPQAICRARYDVTLDIH